jgi:hypothetical protein
VEIRTLPLFDRFSAIGCWSHAGLDPLVTARLATAQVAIGGEQGDFDAIAATLKTRRMRAFRVFGVHVHARSQMSNRHAASS